MGDSKEHKQDEEDEPTEDNEDKPVNNIDKDSYINHNIKNNP